MFNLWNWFLAIKGLTTIEYWGGKNPARNPQADGSRKFNSEGYLDNLEQIFGSKKILRILKPTFKKMHSDGVKWSTNTDDLESGFDESSLSVMTN